jgi:hypothetical protein
MSQTFSSDHLMARFWFKDAYVELVIDADPMMIGCSNREWAERSFFRVFFQVGDSHGGILRERRENLLAEAFGIVTLRCTEKNVTILRQNAGSFPRWRRALQ